MIEIAVMNIPKPEGNISRDVDRGTPIMIVPTMPTFGITKINIKQIFFSMLNSDDSSNTWQSVSFMTSFPFQNSRMIRLLNI
jgi:hypothetical protein